MEACRRLREHVPENSYRFFPGDEPWTWEKGGAAGLPWNGVSEGEVAAAQQGRGWVHGVPSGGGGQLGESGEDYYGECPPS